MSQDPEKAFEALLKRHLSDNLATGNVSTKCPDENVVSAYLEGTLTQDLRTGFEKHASHCVRCQDELSLLLRSREAVAVDPSAQVLAVQDNQGGWLRTFQYSLAWFSNLGLKPALAVLAVTLISGYVGVELFQRESQRRESAAEVAQSIPQDRSGVEGGKRSHPGQEMEKREGEAKPTAPEVVNGRLRANEEGYLKRTKKVADAGESGVPRNDALSKDANQEKSLRDGYSPAPAESSEADKTLQLESRSDSPARQGVAVGLPAAPSPEPSSQVIREHSTDAAKALKNPSPAGKTNAVTRQAIPENQSVLVSAQPSTDEEAESKPDVKAKEAALEKKANVHSLSARGAVAPGKLRQEASAHPKAVSAGGPPIGKKQRQLRVAGKTFELRNNVWTDLSIEERDDREVEVTIYRNSPDYREQIKPLSAYRSVLSRDEDCLIEYQGKIYHIKNSR
jgi:hypothetical protein